MRPALTPVIRGRPSTKRVIFICGKPCWVFVFLSSLASFILWFVSCGILTVSCALAIGLTGDAAQNEDYGCEDRIED